MKRVLVVDDEEGVRETLRDVFEDEGYAVDTAVDGKAGLDALRSRGPYALVVLDLLMPNMNGDELLNAMRAEDALAKIPIIMMTAHPDAAPPGVLLMRKPVDVNVLINTAKGIC